VLTGALDELVETGELTPDRRVDGPMVAWSAVHGLSSVIVRRMMPGPGEEQAALDAVLRGVRRALALRDP
jgi:hypothetical protein